MVALARGREIAAGFKELESLEPILVSSAPPGVDFTNCITQADTGHCCVDFVRAVSTLITGLAKVSQGLYFSEGWRDQICGV